VNLPSGWEATCLAGLADFVMGQAPPGTECNSDGIGTPFVKAGEFGSPRPIIREWTTKPLKMAETEDVLICVVGATAGKLNLGADCAIGRSVAAIRPSAATSAAFIYPRLQSEVMRLRSSSTGTAQGVISKEMLGEIAIALPPLAEQRRIVAKLDALTAPLARARAELDRVPVLAERMRETALMAVKEELVDVGIETVEQLALITFDGPFGSNLKSADYTSSGVRVVRLENIGHREFIADKQTFIAHDKYDSLKRHTLQADDVLFSSFVDREVRVCRFPADGGTAINKADCFAIRLDQGRSDPRFVTYMLSGQDTYEAMKGLVHGATRPRIGLGALRTYGIPVPGLHEQKALADKLDAAFARANRMEAEAARARALIDRLEAALLAKAFRGELVPQDPGDEPASTLLARIRTQRAATPKAKRGRKPKEAA